MSRNTRNSVTDKSFPGDRMSMTKELNERKLFVSLC